MTLTRERALAAVEPLGALPLPGWLAYAGAVLSGVLYFLAFGGMDVWPLAFVALVPLAVSLRRQPTRRAATLGWVAGTTMNFTGFFWLQRMLETFGGFPAIVCVFFVFVVCAYQGGRMGLLGWIHARATARGWPAAPVFAAAFVASELVYPLLFPWYFAATVHQVPVLTQLAEIGGPILVGLVLVAANIALAELLIARAERRGPDRATLATGAAAVALTCVYGECGASRDRRGRPGEHGAAREARRLRRGAAAAPAHVGGARARPEDRFRRVERDLRDARGARRLVPAGAQGRCGEPQRRARRVRSGHLPARHRRARLRPLQRRGVERRGRHDPQPLRQGVPADLRRVHPVRRDVPGPLFVVAEQRPFQPGDGARPARRRRRRRGAPHLDPHLLRGHPSAVHERRRSPRRSRAP